MYSHLIDAGECLWLIHLLHYNGIVAVVVVLENIIINVRPLRDSSQPQSHQAGNLFKKWRLKFPFRPRMSCFTCPASLGRVGLVMLLMIDLTTRTKWFNEDNTHTIQNNSIVRKSDAKVVLCFCECWMDVCYYWNDDRVHWVNRHSLNQCYCEEKWFSHAASMHSRADWLVSYIPLLAVLIMISRKVFLLLNM